jgi:hypothetical protein
VTCEKVDASENDKEQTDYRKPSCSKRLACCSVALALPSPSDWLMRCHKRERGVRAFALNQHKSVGHAARHISGISGSSSQSVCLPTWPTLKIYSIQNYTTRNKSNYGTTVGRIFTVVPNDRTIYVRRRLRNLVGARQNVLYSINFLGTEA